MRLAIAMTSLLGSVEAVLRAILGEEGPSQFAAIAAGDAVANKKPAQRDKAIALLSYFTVHDVQAGDQVFHQGDNADGAILLVRGNLSANFDLGDGQLARLHKFLAPTLTGEMAYCTGSKRSASLVADTDATIGAISAESILRLNLDPPALAAEFHQMSARLMAYRIISMNAVLRTLLAGTTIPGDIRLPR